MMREILFRGKRIDNDEWVYGAYQPPVEWGGRRWDVSIACVTEYGWLEDMPVIPETVGQFTGLTDKNGKKIFEGDVVAYCWYEAEPMNFRINFECGGFLVVPVKKRKDVWAIRISGQGENLEIIGNIHDNQKLLEAENG